MIVERERYLRQLVDRRGNGQVKVITGLRRSGKSFLLHVLFRDFLLREGVDARDIFSVELDTLRDLRFRDPLVLASTVRGWAAGCRRPCLRRCT